MAHLEMLLDETPTDDTLSTTLPDVMVRVTALTDVALADGGEALARRAASALYHLTSAVAMAWESACMGSPERMYLARLVVQHRLLAADPLATGCDAAGRIENIFLAT